LGDADELLQAQIALANESGGELGHLLAQETDAILQGGQSGLQWGVRRGCRRRRSGGEGRGGRRGSGGQRAGMEASQLLELLEGQAALARIQGIRARGTLSQAKPATQGLGIDLKQRTRDSQRKDSHTAISFRENRKTENGTIQGHPREGPRKALGIPREKAEHEGRGKKRCSYPARARRWI